MATAISTEIPLSQQFPILATNLEKLAQAHNQSRGLNLFKGNYLDLQAERIIEEQCTGDLAATAFGYYESLKNH